MTDSVLTMCLQLTVTFLHFAWQGLVLGGIAWIWVCLTNDAKLRYRGSLIVLLLMTACVPITFYLVAAMPTERLTHAKNTAIPIALSSSQTPSTQTIAGRQVEVPLTAFSGKPTTKTSTPETTIANNPSLSPRRLSLQEIAPWVIGGYLIGLVGLLSKLLFSLSSAANIRRHATLITDSKTVNLARAAAARMGYARTPAVFSSDRLYSPVVMGIVRPTILLPAAMLSGLTVAEVDTILSHEIAHMHRNDLLANLAQRVIESLLFFHPCVWLVSRQLSVERENCCDDMVVEKGCDSMVYVSALLRLTEACLPAKAPIALDSVSLAAASKNPSAFKRRLFRLMGEPKTTSPVSIHSAILAIIVVVSGLGMGCVLAQRTANTLGAPQVPSLSAHHWRQLGGNSHRNNVAQGTNIPTTWDVRSGENVLWQADLRRLANGFAGSSAPIVADGRVFIGTANPDDASKEADKACIVCLDQATGKRQWVYSSPRLPGGRHHDWPMQPMESTPCIDGDRLYFVSNRCEIVCLNVADGTPHWKLDMMKELSITPHHITPTSPTIIQDVILVGTSNGVHTPKAPCFVAVNKNTGQVLWQNDFASKNTLNSQFSSPAYGVFDGVPQAIFAGGDGWLYAFDFRHIQQGKTKLLWKFDGNPKTSKWILGGQGTRNHFLASPVISDGLVYIAVGQVAEHGEGNGHLWCIDPTGRGDISTELVEIQSNEQDTERSTKLRNFRLQAADPDKGDIVTANPNSGVVWHFSSTDHDEDGKIAFEEQMHRTVANATIANGLALIPDFAGLMHCLDAKTGKQHWTFDMLAATLATPLVVDNKVYVGDEDGEIAIFDLSDKLNVINQVSMRSGTYSTITCVDNTLYIADRTTLVAVKKGAQSGSPNSSQ